MKLVAFGAMVMKPSTKTFVAGPLPPGPLFPEVERVTVTWCPCVSPIFTVAVALAVNVPAVLLLMVSVHVAVLPLSTGEAQVLVLVTLGVGLTLADMAMLSRLAPSGSAVAVMVKVWVLFTSFTPLGVITTLAST